jgi:membrane fusion protein (multidrug efflux system)
MFPLRGFFRKRRGGVLSLPSCTVVMVWLWAAACSSHASPHLEKPRLPVTTPLRKDTVLYDRYVCQIRAARHIEVRALEQGYLQAIYVDEGQFVRAGQPLFQILPAIYQAEYQKAQAELHYAEVEYQNARILADSGVISPSQLALVRAKLEKAQAELTLAQTHLQFTFIRAPFDGIVGMLQVRIGSLLEEGELLTTLTDNSELWVYFNLPERDYLDYMRRVRPDSTVKVKLELANGQIFPYEGVITAIEAEFDNTTGNVPVRATFPNPQRLLRHGETGNILIPRVYSGALLIPQRATYEVLDKKYVYVVGEDGKLSSRLIEVEAELPHLYIVSKGLSGKDRLLLEGLNRVHEDDFIEGEFIPPEKALEKLPLHAE